MATTSDSSSGLSRRRVLLVAGALLFLLLALNIFLLLNRAEQNRTNRELTEQLDETEQLKATLEQQYYEALSELEEMRGSNEELNALIEQQQEDIRRQRDRIEALLGDRSNLAEARRQIADLQRSVERYVAEINQLRAQNQQLLATNDQLVEAQDSLADQLDSERATNEELSAARAALVNKTEELEAERSNLRRKVNIASVVKVDQIEATGLKVRNSGRRSPKRFAKNIDELRVCFATEVNEVTDPGAESFPVRIVNPLGETLYLESMGSTVITDYETGEDIRVTKVVELEYERTAENVCLVWTPNQALSAGTYAVEIYNKGYLAGSTFFELK